MEAARHLRGTSAARLAARSRAIRITLRSVGEFIGVRNWGDMRSGAQDSQEPRRGIRQAKYPESEQRHSRSGVKLTWRAGLHLDVVQLRRSSSMP